MALAFRIPWKTREGGRWVSYTPGDELPEGHPKTDWLVKNRIVVDPDAAPVVVKVEDPVAAPEPHADAVEEDDLKEDVPRPPKVANRDKWDAYARSQGVDPSKFKSKEELIAAL